MDENAFLLEDRIAKIRSIDGMYGLKENAYISFSGGKDSTAVHYLMDIALPGNRIPRVFINTGIEYRDIVDFVKEMAEHDDRFVILKPKRNITEVLQTYGYPFKSKEHACKVGMFQSGSEAPSVAKYAEGGKFGCPKSLQYQFSEGLPFKVSDKCCHKLKKEPAHEYETESGRKIAILGVRQDEGGQRRNHSGCIVLRGNEATKFKPLNPMSDSWLEWFIREKGIRLCRLYYPPFGFRRTGCKGCPFSTDIQRQLDAMQEHLPKERAQCEVIWKPVYEEYRRTGYRLRKEEGNGNG